MRRVHLEQLRGVGKKFVARHRVNLLLRRSVDVDGRVDGLLYGDWRLAPTGQRRDLESFLNGMNRGVVGRAIGLGSADDPHMGCRSVDAGESRWHLSVPAGRRQQEIRSLGSCSAPARRSKYIGPRSEERRVGKG